MVEEEGVKPNAHSARKRLQAGAFPRSLSKFMAKLGSRQEVPAHLGSALSLWRTVYLTSVPIYTSPNKLHEFMFHETDSKSRTIKISNTNISQLSLESSR